MITLTTYAWVPDFAAPLMRAFRVRWALEEIGLPYNVRTVALGPDQKSPAHLARQPFGQAPAIEEGALTLFESGAIALYVAEKSDDLLPREPIARARATAWVFAALNSVETWIQQLASIDFFHKKESWAKEARPGIEKLVRERLSQLEKVLEGKDYLEGSFIHPRWVIANAGSPTRTVDSCQCRQRRTSLRGREWIAGRHDAAPSTTN